MKSLKENSVARICLLFTKLSWYLFVTVGSLLPVFFMFAYFNKLPEQLAFDVTIPLSNDVLNLSSNIDQLAIVLDSAKAQLSVSYFAQQFPDAFISFAIFIVLLLAMVLTGLFQLKKLLQTTLDSEVFTRKNIRRIKIIALLLFLVDPLFWIYHHFFFDALFAKMTASSFRITMSSPIFNYWFIGLLIYTLAAVFEKGHEMYKELKLTV